MTSAPSARHDDPGADLVRVRMLVAYDGSPYRGFARNRDVPTVAAALEDAVATVTRHPVTLTAAGRTDAGVHAWGQVVSGDLPAADLAGLPRRLNALLGPTVVVRAAAVARPGFDARFSARWRRYRYTVLTTPWPDPFRAGTVWHVPRPLSLRDLRLATDPLVGEHDFSAFCRRPRGTPGEPTMVRRVLDADWHDDGDGTLRFEIRANAFCHQMVRSAVGTLVEVGAGRRRAGDVLAILRSRDRSRAGQLAPPHGLCLWEVGYDDPDGTW